MSTQGCFILRKTGADKSMRIASDAYPSGAGADICDLIKTTDLDLLYECLKTDDESDISCSDDPEPFSYERCRLAVKRKMQLRISDDFGSGILNSLFCEHAYVVDFDNSQMQYFVGGQTQPQPDNPYGMQPVKPFSMDKEYYPCRLARVFSLDYIRAVSINQLVEEMERVNQQDVSDIRYINEPIPGIADQCAPGWNDHVKHMMLEMEATTAQLEIMRRTIPGLQPVCDRRIRELARDCTRVYDAVNALSKRIVIMQ